MTTRPTLTLHPVEGVGEVRASTPLAEVLVGALTGAGLTLTDGDVVVVSSKVVSKASGLRSDDPDRQRLVIEQCRRVVAERATADGVTRIVEALAGPVMAGAGIDGSNTGPEGGLLLLPHDPDAAARTLRGGLYAAAGLDERTRLGVVLSDTAGRPWRVGQVDMALGAAGVVGVEDLRGGIDADGRPLAVTVRAVADEIASAADLVSGKASGVPAVLVRGLVDAALPLVEPGEGARALVRTGPGDWFGLGDQEAVRTALGVRPGSPASVRVGVRPTGDESVTDRVARAVAVARHREDQSLEVTLAVAPGLVSQHPAPPPVRAQVRGTDALAVGRVCARLEVALRGEGCDPDVVPVVLGTR